VIAKAGVFPLARVLEPVKIEVPDVKRLLAVGETVGLDNRIGGALDTALHAQSMQQVPHQRGLAGAELAVQCDESVGEGRAVCPDACKRARGVFIGPVQLQPGGGGHFYNGSVTIHSTQFDGDQLVSQVRAWARELGFSQIGVAGVDLSSAEPGLLAWLAAGFHGEMDYMQRHGLKRARPAELLPGTVSVITARMDYLPRKTPGDWSQRELERLQQPGEAVVSVYARGRDYHKVMRARLQTLGERLAGAVGLLGHRAYVDSAPVLEAELAARSGQGWRGKHSLVLNRDAGSMLFLGEIYTDLALPHSEAVLEHCGSCSACIDVCPTRAIIAPYRLDARRCISYLTIEHAGPIPLELRPLMGNRIYGCDDCQLVCPWNKFAQRSALPDFDERAGLGSAQLVTLFAWDEAEFLRYTEGSAIRRIGHERWLRNIAVALGNALRMPSTPSRGEALNQRTVRAALSARLHHPDLLVREHVHWALAQR